MHILHSTICLNHKIFLFIEALSNKMGRVKHLQYTLHLSANSMFQWVCVVLGCLVRVNFNYQIILLPHSYFPSYNFFLIDPVLLDYEETDGHVSTGLIFTLNHNCLLLHIKTN